MGADPVQVGLVTSFNRPGGNVTGIASMNVELGAKRVGLLHELLPAARRIGALVNGTSNLPLLEEVKQGASNLGLEVEVYTISNFRDIEIAFADFIRKRVHALIINPGAPLSERRVQLATLSIRHALPMMAPVRENVELGGLMSYGPSLADEFRNAGIYTGRILKGEKPSDLPVMRATKFEFVVNLQTARALDIIVPPTLLARADEVIE